MANQRPLTLAEQLVAQQAQALQVFNVYRLPGAATLGPMCNIARGREVVRYSTPIDREFWLDRPLQYALLLRVAKSNPEEALRLAALLTNVPERPLSRAESDAAWHDLQKNCADAVWGGGNVLGNTTATLEAYLKARWQRQAAEGFAKLLAGSSNVPIQLGPHIRLISHRIRAGGELGRGARIKVKVSVGDARVLQELPLGFTNPSGRSHALLRVSARNTQAISRATVGVAQARAATCRFLRATTAHGGAALAFAPTAAIDFYKNYHSASGFDVRGFLVDSGQSQSGNAVGFVAGFAASRAIGAAVGAAVIGAGVAGWPVVVISLGVGLIAQVAWSQLGLDEASGDMVDRLLPRP